MCSIAPGSELSIIFRDLVVFHPLREGSSLLVLCSQNNVNSRTNTCTETEEHIVKYIKPMLAQNAKKQNEKVDHDENR